MRAAQLKDAFSVRRNLVALWRAGDAYPALDGIRALAVLWVLVFHCVSIPVIAPSTGPTLARYVRHPIFTTIFAGSLAVDVFLVLAGFLMAHLLLGEHARTGGLRVGRFFARRWMRMVPLYAAAVALYMAIDPVQRATCARWGWANLLFLNNFFGPQLRPESCLGHGWSMAVEFQLYLVSPLVVVWMLASRRAAAVPWLLVAAGLVATSAIVLLQHSPSAEWYGTALYDKPYGRSAPYFAGMAAAYAVRRAAVAAPRPVERLLVALAGGVVLAIVLVPPDLLDRRPLLRQALLLGGRQLFGAALAYLVYAMLTGRARLLERALAARAWLPIARLSYAAYLVQFVCIVPLCARFAPRVIRAASLGEVLVALGAQTAAALALTFALALVGFLFVEKPFMNLRR